MTVFYTYCVVIPSQIKINILPKKTMIYFYIITEKTQSKQSFGDHDVHVSIGIHNHP